MRRDLLADVDARVDRKISGFHKAEAANWGGRVKLAAAVIGAVGLIVVAGITVLGEHNEAKAVGAARLDTSQQLAVIHQTLNDVVRSIGMMNKRLDTEHEWLKAELAKKPMVKDPDIISPRPVPPKPEPTPDTLPQELDETKDFGL